MASKADHSNTALATRLEDHADGIVNVAAHEMEQDIRLAASRLRECTEPQASLMSLLREFRALADSASPATAERLRRLIGDA